MATATPGRRTVHSLRALTPSSQERERSLTGPMRPTRALAAVLADQTRAAMCLALLDGRAWTAGELATHTGVASSTVPATWTAAALVFVPAAGAVICSAGATESIVTFVVAVAAFPAASLATAVKVAAPSTTETVAVNVEPTIAAGVSRIFSS